MVPCKNRIDFKQYMKNKPVKWGIKIYTVCCSIAGLLLAFMPYLGKKNAAITGQTSPEITAQALLRPFEYRNRRCHIDRFFTSIPLLKSLKERGIFAAGTIRSNRAGVPAELKVKLSKAKHPRAVSATLTPGRTVPRGYTRVLNIEGDLIAGVFADSVPVLFVSAFHKVDDRVPINRRLKGSADQTAFETNRFILDHNLYARGVDRFDQMSMAYAIGRRSFRWSLTLFFWLLNAAITNAVLLYHLELRRRKQTVQEHAKSLQHIAHDILVKHHSSSLRGLQYLPLTHVSVRYQLGDEHRLRTLFLNPELKADPRYQAQVPPEAGTGDHWAVKADKRRHCLVCQARTYFICEKCTFAMCVGCLPTFHKRLRKKK